MAPCDHTRVEDESSRNLRGLEGKCKYISIFYRHKKQTDSEFSESQKEQELDGLVSVAISTGVEEQARSVLPQVRLASIERCVHKFPDFQKCFSSSGNKRKRIFF